MMDSVAIVSGGLDSVTLLHYLIKKKGLKPAVITFLYGQKHAREVACAELHARQLGAEPHTILDLSSVACLFSTSALTSQDVEIPDIVDVMGDPQPPSYVPNRNMVFLSLAVAYAENHGVSDIYYGAQRHDVYGYWDTTPDFLTRLNTVYALNRKTPVNLYAPFVHYSKRDILKLGLELGVDYSSTWSCYRGRDLACGRCPTCSERLRAFQELDLIDPLTYEGDTGF